MGPTEATRKPRRTLRQLGNREAWTADKVRERIRVGVIVSRLENHVLGNCEMSATQVRAAEILLRKTVPDLQVTTLQNPDGSPLNFTVSVPPKNGPLGPDAKAG